MNIDGVSEQIASSPPLVLHGPLPLLLHVRLGRRPGAGFDPSPRVGSHVCYPETSIDIRKSKLCLFKVWSTVYTSGGPVIQFDVHHIAVPWLSLGVHSTVEAAPDLNDKITPSAASSLSPFFSILHHGHFSEAVSLHMFEVQRRIDQGTMSSPEWKKRDMYSGCR